MSASSLLEPHSLMLSSVMSRKLKLYSKFILPASDWLARARSKVHPDALFFKFPAGASRNETCSDSCASDSEPNITRGNGINFSTFRFHRSKGGYRKLFPIKSAAGERNCPSETIFPPSRPAYTWTTCAYNDIAGPLLAKGLWRVRNRIIRA